MPPASMLAVFAWLVTIGFTAALIRLTWTSNCFFGDDFGTFTMSYEGGWLDALLLPMGSGQVIPLQRASALLLYAAFPMSWTAGTLVMAAFHVVGITYLYRTLQLLAKTRINAVVTALYATNVLAGLPLTWFSSGTMRLPYVAFSLVAIHHYLRFCRSAERRHLAVVVLANAIALGFYSKAIFIPLYCVAVDMAWRGMGALRSDRKEWPKWLVVTLLVAFMPIYALVTRSFLEGGAREVNLDALLLLRSGKMAFTFLGHSLAGIVLSVDAYEPSWLVGILWAPVFVYSVVRCPKTLRIWLLGALVVSLNLALLSVSNRGALLRGAEALEKRYFFELTFLAAIFLAMVVHELRLAVPELRALTRGRSAAVAAAVAAALLGVYVATTYPRFADIARTSPSPMTCAYLDRLEADLGLLAKLEHVPTVRDGQLGIEFHFLRHSQLFRLLHAPAEFRPDGRFFVGHDGSIVLADEGTRR